MNEVLSPSKTGTLTAFAGDIALHSSYNPMKEAERYIESINMKKDITHFILLEPALAYTIPFLKKKNPLAKIIVLRCSSFFSAKGNTDAEWFPNEHETLQTFLERHIDDADISHIKILEWLPSSNAYADIYASLLKEIHIFLKRCAANITTAKIFGPRWIKNCVKNICALKAVLTCTKGSCSILVCGAGHGLETSIDAIKDVQQKEHLFIIAVSSSFLTLKTHGIVPDIVIGSDGGNWAKLHFIEYERISPQNHFVCASLNAALPSQSIEHPVLLISDGSAWQSQLLREFSIPHLRFPQRGTVTAAALDLAFQLTSENVFVSGIDLSHNDLCSHSRPYAFDMLIYAKANRFCPYYSEMFKRKEKENPEALRIYADWFKQYITNYSGRIFSLGKNHELFPQCTQDDFPVSPRENSLPKFSVTMGKKNNEALKIFMQILDDTDRGTLIRHELKELLSVSGEDENADSVLRKKLAALLDRYAFHGEM